MVLCTIKWDPPNTKGEFPSCLLSLQLILFRWKCISLSSCFLCGSIACSCTSAVFSRFTPRAIPSLWSTSPTPPPRVLLPTHHHQGKEYFMGCWDNVFDKRKDDYRNGVTLKGWTAGFNWGKKAPLPNPQMKRITYSAEKQRCVCLKINYIVNMTRVSNDALEVDRIYAVPTHQ